MVKPGSRDVLLLLTSMVLASVPVGYLQVVLPLYLNRAGLEPALIGLLYSLSGLVTAALVAFSGTLADRFGRRGFLIWGTALPIWQLPHFRRHYRSALARVGQRDRRRRPG